MSHPREAATAPKQDKHLLTSIKKGFLSTSQKKKRFLFPFFFSNSSQISVAGIQTNGIACY